ncbi:small ubiquitin-related modifier 3-like [Acyrthosiphon pisum]|uniref:Small ubiquitin-related modifier n=1 Tax=Acyrthosiphon pisum TaxID=7029 RepID=A0A8R1W5M0_ACYPI|nr:small ubiquitin-related modifier 3-like [Acyrthosiphon pisum]|eukprot:XP_003244070.1 PREDICTED: small ubiquitin-related modifier 3-like [Acyrthosiphon pisum]
MVVDKSDAPEIIHLEVFSFLDHTVVQFKIKKHTPLKKLLKAYCERTGLEMATIRFRFNGRAIGEADTASSLEMEEGDTIDVHEQQTGGQNIFLDYY